MSSPSLSTRSSFESLHSSSFSVHSSSSSPHDDASLIHSSSSSIINAPDKLAPPAVGPMVWQGDQLDPNEYVVHLSQDEVKDIRAAIIKFKLSGLALEQITRETFDLGNARLATKLSSLSARIHDKRGVVVLRGLGRERLSDIEAVMAFTGINAYVCPERATDSYANQTLTHVRDASKQRVPKACRGIGLAGSKMPAAMDFHSDRFSGDVLALYVRDDGGPGSGGQQFVASFSRIYNELLETEPEVLETMAEPDWPFEVKNDANNTSLSPGPVLFFSRDGGKPICQLVKAPLVGTPTLPRSAHAPSLTARQVHALETVQRLAQRFSTALDRQTGDVQYVHNLSVLHARTAYTSARWGEASTRHLLRMFVRDPARAWPKPMSWLAHFEDPFARGRLQTISVVDTDPWRLISGRESHG